MKTGKRKVMWIITGILVIVSMVVMYMTHRVIPFMMDDIWYSTMLYDDTIPITSFSDIIVSQIWHYFHWGGRSITHGMLQMTLLAGEQAADCLNVLFTLLLGGMACLVSGHRRLPAFFAAIAMTLGLNANWRMSMFWQAGAANYLYITVFILAFAYCYLREVPEAAGKVPYFLPEAAGKVQRILPEAAGEAQRFLPETEDAVSHPAVEGEGAVPHSLPGITIWIIPLGVIAGWSNENMGPAVWILSLAVIVLAFKEKRKIRPWMVLGNLACLVGSIVCIAAPGNFIRSSQVEEVQYGTLWKIFLRCYGECKGALEYLFPTLLVLGFLWILSRCVLKQAVGRREILLLVCALLSWGAMILSPHYPDRASFGTMLLCICEILLLGRKILEQRSDLAWPLWCGAVLIWLRGMYFCGEFLAIVWGWIK